jgi:hypothetical protein
MRGFYRCRTRGGVGPTLCQDPPPPSPRIVRRLKSPPRHLLPVPALFSVVAAPPATVAVRPLPPPHLQEPSTSAFVPVSFLVQGCLRDAFTSLDTEFLGLAKRDGLDDGSTALLTLLVGNDPEALTLVVANTGDCRAVLCRGGTCGAGRVGVGWGHGRRGGGGGELLGGMGLRAPVPVHVPVLWGGHAWRLPRGGTAAALLHCTHLGLGLRVLPACPHRHCAAGPS